MEQKQNKECHAFLSSYFILDLVTFGYFRFMVLHTSYEQAKNFPKIKYEHPTGSWYFIRQTSQFKLTSIEKK